MPVTIKSDLLSEVREYFEKAPELASDSAMMAINSVITRSGLASMKRDIMSQVAFPAGYLDLENRLAVTRKANKQSLEGMITGRDRATSLARFAPGQTPQNTRGKGVTVAVKRGRTKTLKKAFLVSLKNGNVGLAVRLKPGETLKNKTYGKPVMLGKNLYLLYAPSVDQVFRTVAEDSLPMLGDSVAKEFYRNFARLSRGK